MKNKSSNFKTALSQIISASPEEPNLEFNQEVEESIKREFVSRENNLETKPSLNSKSVISKEMVIEGTIHSKGDIEVQGSIKGNVTTKGQINVSGRVLGSIECEALQCDNGIVEGETVIVKSNLNVELNSVIKAEIHAENINVNGKIIGDILSRGKVTLFDNANVKGNIQCNAIVVEEGAMIGGMINTNRESN